MRSPIIAAFCFSLSACAEVTFSDVRTERGTVEDVCFVPAGHATGGGVTASGDYVATSSHIPARYATVFRCDHGKFVITGEETWKAAIAGQDVIIYYRVEYRDGVEHDLDFLYHEPAEGSSW